jgi:hypothetical protein
MKTLNKSENPIVVVNIPDEVIDAIVEIGDQVALWAKVTETGFLINDKIFSEISGRIINMNLHYVKWTDKKPHKILFELGKKLPEGYESRLDLFVEVDGQVVGISLSKSSLKYHLSPYLRNLKNIGMRPEDVISRLRVKQVTNKFGSFNVVIFDAVDKVAEPIPVTPSPVVNQAPDSSPPQQQGSATQAADPSNPWA